MGRVEARLVMGHASRETHPAQDRRLRSVAVAWSLALALALGFLLFASPARVMGAEPPPGMTRQQFDALVASVAEALSKGLSQASPERSEAGATEDDSIDTVSERVNELLLRAPDVITALPELPAQTARVLGRFDRSAAGGKSAGMFLFVLSLAGAAALGIGWVLRALLAPLRRSLASIDAVPLPMSRVLGLALLEAAPVAVVWMLIKVELGSLFVGQQAQAAFASKVLDVVLLGAVAAAIGEVWLRPRLPAARLVLVDDGNALLLKRLLVTAVVIVGASRVWLGLIATPAMVSAVLLVNAFVIAGTYAWVVRRGRIGLGSWLAGLATPSPGEDLVARSTRLVQMVAMPFIGVIFLLRVYAALSARPSVPLGTIATVSTIVLFLLSETLIRWLQRHPGLQNAEDGLHVRLLRSAARLARILVILVGTVALVRVWSVDALGLVSEQDWRMWSRALWQAALCGFGGALVWEAVRASTDRYVAPAHAGTSPDADETIQETGSRAKTLAPLLRIAALVVIVAITVLAMLSVLGVNITPLIAGASILGLAISFGSQTLVKDIVSGIFFLAEDAFRVGEYIDCGKAKGTVEGFALRSLKLRHQNGQLHTIPFGQLGQVTNFSRDWATVKFNLRVARNTDLEVLRRATKKVGIALAEDPTFADDFLQPLKMQGVAEILDEALVARFKFTVRPSPPSQIQREAIKRLIRDLPAAGVSFPQPVRA